MKKIIYHFIILNALIGGISYAEPDTNEWGEVNAGLQMSIGLVGRNNNVETNEPVFLLIRYRNASTNQVEIFEVNGTINDPTYSFIVNSPTGRDISPNMKQFGDSMGVLYPSGRFHFLDPNQTAEIKFNLGGLCKFNEIGTYKIIAKKENYSPEVKKKVTIVSNPLYLTVVPGNWEPIRPIVSVKGGINEIKTNEPVSLLIGLTNISAYKTFYTDITPPARNRNFTFTVSSPDGKDISPTKLPHLRFGAFIPVDPQTTSQSQEYDISDFCKFDEIGKYKITVNINIYSVLTHGFIAVTSSPVYLTVVPGYWKPETTNAVP